MDNKEMREVFGLEVPIEFDEQTTFNAVPQKMKTMGLFMSHFVNVNYKELYRNYLFDENATALTQVLEMTFPTVSMDDINNKITPTNYPKIMEKICAINGIDISEKQDPNEPKEV